MGKAKTTTKTVVEKAPPEIAEEVSTTETMVSGGNQEVQVLKAQVAHLQTEVDTLKRQVGQLINFIKQKMR